MRRFGAGLVFWCVLAAQGVSAQTFVAKPPLATEQRPVTLLIDASSAGDGLLRVHERIPAARGQFTIVYPEWIPGEHGPTGPLSDLAALRISAHGTTLDWRRDSVDMYAFHVSVPAETDEIDCDFDVLMNAPDDVMSTHSLFLLNWNRALLYQEGIDSRHYFVRPSIVLPRGWDFATALREPTHGGERVSFAVTSLEMLVDSPLDAGRYARKWDLWSEGSAFVQLDAFADYPQDLDIPSELLKAYERIPAEAFAMYGSRHFADYHALLTLSDAVGFQGIEHHQSSDNRAPDNFLTDPQQSLAGGDLVTHEFSHSWNGKYRRPADLTTPNFQVPQQTDLLWVYEGMNQYLGDVLSFRSGIRKPRLYPEYLATVYADMDYETGRATTPLIDLTTGAPHFFEARGDYRAIRRTANDFYTEGELVWLDVDTIIRERSRGERSLDTFLHRYTEPGLTGPIVVTYTRGEVEHLLEGVEPYDWHGFFERYVYHTSVHPPTDELARAGWRIVYNDKPNEFITANDSDDRGINGWYAYGANFTGDGAVRDVRESSPAWRAGLAPGMKVLAVNGQQFSPDSLVYALGRAQHSTNPISLIVTQTGWYQTLSLDYHGGIAYPHLERIAGTKDMLAEIVAPHA
ncbi:MAG: M61 family metallopeptidase, partial [Candidatus Eremiobacteraeota bacterium]|nr:M61 family metallopeptidase [Candidatus Eremiobacteraeota bacterium]